MRHRSPHLPVLALLVASLVPAPALAEHENDHRYHLEGFVLDAAERPRSGVPVSASVPGGAHGGARTDADGFFSIQLHLHDADIGKQIQLRAGSHQASVRMVAERGDQTTKRLHHVNFVGDRLVEQRLARAPLPGWVWGVVTALALVALGAAVTWAERRRKRRRRQAIEAGRAAARGVRRKGRER